MVYAIGEILLVMIGILLALQVNNWNQNRIQDQLEILTLQNLNRDFLTNKERIKSGFITLDKLNRQISRAQDLITSDVADTTNFDAVFSPFFLSYVMTYDPVDGTIVDLLNSNKLNLLKDDILRSKISEWNALLEDIKEHELKVLHFRENDLGPYMINCCPRSELNKVSLKKVIEDYKFDNLLFIYKWLITAQIANYKTVESHIDLILELTGNTGR